MEDKVTIDSITKKISLKTELSASDVHSFLELLIDEMKFCLKKGGKIQIRGVGTFSIKLRAERWGRNIKANKKIFIPAHYSPVFKPGVLLRKKMNIKNKNLAI